MNWNEVQELYDQLMECRGKLAWMTPKDPKLCGIRDATVRAISLQLDKLEEYVAPFRKDIPAKPAKEG